MMARLSGVPRAPLWGLAAAWLAVSSVQAQSETGAAPASMPAPPGPLEEVVVFGRDTQLLGAAEAASEGSVGGADLLVRPMLRVAELLEAVPGMVAVQHSGSGKANQYFLRGFNLDHGTDFTTYVDGMPWNLRSHGHGQGYLDVNGLLPEVVERIDYRKGTYRADVGDFSMAGSSFIRTIDRLEAPFVSLESGQYGWERVSRPAAPWISATDADRLGEYKTYDGPWDLAGSRCSTRPIWGKYLQPTAFRRSFGVTLSGYDGDWHPTEQIPERVIGSAVCPDAFCALDPTAGGHTSALDRRRASWTAIAGTPRHISNTTTGTCSRIRPTTFRSISSTGARRPAGAIDAASSRRSNLELDVGAELRYDDIGPVGARSLRSRAVSRKHQRQRHQRKLARRVCRSRPGCRPTSCGSVERHCAVDYYDFDVTARTAGSFPGQKTDSARLAEARRSLTRSTTVSSSTATGASGFHSNDARGVVNPTTPVPGLSPGTGYEGGARLRGRRFQDHVGLLVAQSRQRADLRRRLELGRAEGGSKRDGYELTASGSQPTGSVSIRSTPAPMPVIADASEGTPHRRIGRALPVRSASRRSRTTGRRACAFVISGLMR